MYARALRRAADILGGKDLLRAALHVPMHSLEEWLDGRSEPPIDIFLKAVDILSTPTGSAPATAATLRARALTRTSGELIRDAGQTVARSRTLTDALRSAAVQQKVLAGFLVATFGPDQRIEMLESALDAALEAAHAPMGNVQLKDKDGLHIVTQRGLAQPFLDFFARVTEAQCACGTASQAGSRVVVSDVATDPIFAGSEAGRVLQAAGIRAVQSTPLVSATGNLLGMLSTHYDHPGTPGKPELEAIDQIAERAAYWLEQATA
ncbi:MAG TPA: GAF domain-containing protein [Burkholderiales bacterium]|nr:GAF domain-containing protein [Burkholderiales bacterium]